MEEDSGIFVLQQGAFFLQSLDFEGQSGIYKSFLAFKEKNFNE